MADTHVNPGSRPEAAPGDVTAPGRPEAAAAKGQQTEEQPGSPGASFFMLVIWAAAFIGLFLPTVLELIAGMFRKAP